MDYRDRSLVLRIVGVVLLLAGIGVAFLGPLEMYVFYLFSTGGRFHYEGFEFGSFMFGNIASQIIGYYAIGAVLVPLGYGHLRMRRWARTLSLTLLRFWQLVGIPLVAIFFLVLVASKELTLVAVVIAAVALALSYLVAPGLLNRFYQSRNVRLTFETRDPRSYAIEGLPIPMLVLCSLYLFYAVSFHVPIYFRGIFAFFGVFLYDLQGIFLHDVSILLMIGLAWGTFKSQMWAWWVALTYFFLLTVSSVLTFLRSSYADILSGLRFPPTEIEFLDGVPLQGYHLALFFGVPLVATCCVIALSKRHFSEKYPAVDPGSAC